MDFLTIAKKRMRETYTNKFFRKLFFIFCLLLVIYKYSNIMNSVNDKDKLINSINIPKKISLIKQVQDGTYIKLATKEEEQQEKELDLQKKKEEEMIRKKKLEERALEVENIKKEFSLTKNINKKAKKLKIGDNVNVKMIILTNNNFNAVNQPVEIVIPINNKKDNIFGKQLLNKKVGDVITIPFKEFLQDKNFKKGFQKGLNDKYIKDMNIDFKQLENFNIVYRIKIIDIIQK